MADPFAKIPKEALDYFRAKDFKIGFDYRDVWKEEHTAAFTVAKAMNLDVLTDIRAAVDQSLANGETFQQFQKRLTPLLVEKGWWGQQDMMDPETGELKPVQLGSPRRLRVIYDTNLRTARAAGQWQRIQESKKSLPYLLYTVGPSREHRPEHLAWHGTLLPVDDPWFETHFAPNGWGCKCRIRAVTQYEYEKLLKTGIQAPPSAATQELDPKTGRPTGHSLVSKVPVRTTAPPLNLQPWTNKRTGLTEQVPQGIDPGWNYNPGASRVEHLQQVLQEKEAVFEAAMGQNAGMKNQPTMIDESKVKSFLESDHPGAVPVATLPPDIREQLAANTDEILLSRYTVDKQRKHPEITAESYGWLQSLIDKGERIAGKPLHVVVIQHRGEWFVAVLKVTKAGDEVYLQSFRRSDAKDIAKLRGDK